MHFKQILLKLLAILMLSSLCTRLQAQITIGSGLPPTAGSLLQLKEDEGKEANSTKGLLLPRLRLTSLTTLVDISNGTINQETLKHAGLTIYNLTETAPFCKGIYVWSGTDWERLGLPCMSYITDLKDIDFGVSAGDTKTISFVTNANWQFLADSNYDKVIAGCNKALNTIHIGGTIEKEEAVSLDITSAGFSPRAGSVQETKLTFHTTEQAIKDGTSINVKRTVPNYISVLDGTSGNIARVTPTISAQAESNDKWSITTFIDGVENQTATQDNAPLNTKTLSLVVPTNESWDIKNVRVDVKSTDANTGVETVKQSYNHAQEAWSLSYANYTNVVNPVPRAGGNYIANMSGDYTGTVNIRAAGNVVGTAGGATATASAKNFTVPPNDSWATRNVQVEHERKPGDPWVAMFSATQSNYFLNVRNNTHGNLTSDAQNIGTEVQGDGPISAHLYINDVYQGVWDHNLTSNYQILYVHVPTNMTAAARNVKVYLVAKGGTNWPGNRLVYNISQAPYYFYEYRGVSPATLPAAGGYAYINLAGRWPAGAPISIVLTNNYGSVPPKIPLPVVIASEGLTTGGTNYPTLVPIPANNTGRSITWSFVIPPQPGQASTWIVGSIVQPSN